MRTLVLSVCVGLLLSACDGSVDKSADEVEGSEGGAGRADAGADGATSGDGEPGGSENDASNSEADGGSSDGGVRDAGMRDAGDSGTRDGGTRDAGSDAAVDAGGTTPDAGGGNTGRPVFVVAGYQGGIAFSKDLGLTWTNARAPTAPYGDNEFVLSGATFAKGTFVVVGYDIFTSTDGEHWTERTSATTQWLGNLNFGLGLFVGVGGVGTSQWSEDAITWHQGDMLGSAGFDTSAFGNGTFMASSKNGQWWSSTDGKGWKEVAAESGHSAKIVWCVDHFADEADCKMLIPTGQTALGEGIGIRAQNGKQLRRFTNNGQSYTDVTVGFDANCAAFGYVP